MAGIKVREIFTAWGFDIDTKPIKGMESMISKLKANLSLTKLAVGAVVGTAMAAAKFTADAGDEAVKTAQKVGLGVEAYQELAYAAKLSDVEVDSLKTSLGILGTNARSAWKGGKEAKDAFNAIGVSATDAQGRLKPTSMLLMEISNHFSNMTEAQREMAPALARGLFGRGGADLLPLLNGGAAGFKALAQEAHNFGAVISENDALVGERFNDNLTRAWAAIKGLRNEIGQQLLPILEPLINSLRDWVAHNRTLIGSAIGPFLSNLGALFAVALSGAMGLANAVILLVWELGPLMDAIRFLMPLLAAFALGKAILTVISFAKTLWTAVAAMQALNFELLLANAMTGFVPILLGLGALGADWALRGDRSIAGSLFGGGAAKASPLPALAGAGRSMTTVTEIKPQINVTVPAASNPTATGTAVAQSAQHELQKMLRQSMTDLQPKVVN